MVPRRNMETLRETTYQQLVESSRGRHESTSAQIEDRNLIDPISEFCNSRLSTLNTHLWTKVPISTELVAQTIYLYLETDHLLLNVFEPRPFL